MKIPLNRQPDNGLNTTSSYTSVSRSGFVKWITLCVVLTNVFVAIVGLIYLRSSRNQYEQKSSIVAQSLAQILEKTIASELDKISLTLLTVKDEFEEHNDSGNIDAQQLNAFLTHQKERLPIIESLRIADEDGLVKYGPGVASAAAANIADREHFIRPRDDPNAGVCICQPVFARISRKWVLPLSQRLNHADGTFAGVAYVIIDIAHFAKLFSVIDIGKHGGISLRDHEMGIIARFPPPEDIGTIIGNKKLSPELQQKLKDNTKSGTFFTPTSWDNVPKVVSYRKIHEYPLYVNIGIATEDYLTAWWQEINMIGGISILFFMLTAFTALIVYRYIDVLRKTSLLLSGSHEKLEQKVNERTMELDNANKSLQEGHSRLITVLNSIDAMVYVADMETHEILFINDYIKIFLGNILGKKCWQVLRRGEVGPCTSCSNKFLIGPDNMPTGVYHSEHFNTVTGRWYDCRARAIPWIDGTIKRLQIATDITERKQAEEDNEKLIASLQDALDNVKQLSGLLPICASCKKIRDDKGYWTQIESYIHTHSEAEFSHSICPDCARKLYPQFCDTPQDDKVE